LAGHSIEKLAGNKNHCLMKAVSQMDIKGDIPTAIVNMAASRSPLEWHRTLMVACQKYQVQKLNAVIK
jgi:hypothetical protein